MNRSGAVLARLQALPEFDPARDLLVLVDDVALPVGRFRLRARGSAGGHNGLKSVEGALHTQEYARLRIGAGPLPDPAPTDSAPAPYDDLADYVLDHFSQEEKVVVHGLLDPMAEAVECWLQEGIEPAMNRFNR